MKDIGEQLLTAGLENLGAVEHLSHWPRLMQESPLMQDFTPAEADILGTVMIRVKARPGQVLIAEDDASDFMMLLLSGTVDVVKRKIGAEVDADEPGSVTRLAVLKDGASLGEMSMLDGEPRYASCIALTEVEAAVLVGYGVVIGLATALCFGLAHPIARVLGKTGINVMTRLMGLILAALAVEVMADGLHKLFPILGR